MLRLRGHSAHPTWLQVRVPRHPAQAQPSGLMSNSFLVPGSGLTMPGDETGVDWAFWNLLSTGLVLSSVTRFPSGCWLTGGSEQMTAALQSPWGLAKYVGGRVNPEHFHLYFNPVPSSHPGSNASNGVPPRP